MPIAAARMCAQNVVASRSISEHSRVSLNAGLRCLPEQR